MSTRDPQDLTPVLYLRYLLWAKDMLAVDLHHVLTSVARSEVEQEALFAQGRSPLWVVNQYRKTAGLPLIVEKDNRKVTWTLESLHLVTPEKPKARAFDFAILTQDNKHVVWDLKADTNTAGGPDYLEAGKLWEKRGGVWGGRFKNPDSCHAQ